MTLGIVTCSEVDQLTESEQRLIPLFREAGVEAKPVVWNDDTVDWASFDHLIIRSVWDYHLHHSAFMNWMTALEHMGVRTLNPVPILRSNQHKFYLRRLQAHGVRIVPTRFIERTERLDLSPLQNGPWEQMVIKPAVSASSFLTEIFVKGELPKIEADYAPIAQERDLLVQQFMPEIRQSGELSLIFIDRSYSHTVLKTAISGEFRVQSEYGGTTKGYQPSASIIETARHILSLVDGPLLYARIDGVIQNGHFVLMEIELIEPELFFEYGKNALERFVTATLKRVRS